MSFNPTLSNSSNPLSKSELRLYKITINYTDGTTITISKNDIESLVGAPNCNFDEIPEDNTYERRFIERDFDSEITTEKRKLSDMKYALSHLDSYLSLRDLPSYLNDFINLKKEILKSIDNLRTFEIQNFIKDSYYKSDVFTKHWLKREGI